MASGIHGLLKLNRVSDPVPFKKFRIIITVRKKGLICYRITAYLMIAYHKPAFFIIAFCGLVKLCAAQFPITDTFPNSQDSNFLVDLYSSAIGENAHLYNGREYFTYDKRIKGNPFFETDSMTAGNISYNGGEYDNVPMLYDITRDEVIINRYHQNFKISLLTEKLEKFTFLNHFFYHMEKDSLHGVLLSPGLYDELYHGNTTVLVKRKKRISEKIVLNANVISYQPDDHFYIKRNNKYAGISNKSSLLKAFNDKKKEIRKYLRKHKIKFKSDPEKAILQSAVYYDQLSS